MLDEVSSASSALSGMCAHLPGFAREHRTWGHPDFLHLLMVLEWCQGFCSFPGPLADWEEEEEEVLGTSGGGCCPCWC